MAVFRNGSQLSIQEANKVRVIRRKAYTLQNIVTGQIAMGDNAQELSKATGASTTAITKLLNGQNTRAKDWIIADTKGDKCLHHHN